MPLITCPDCGKQVSTIALACPSCGRPIAGQADQPSAPPDVVSDKLLAEVQPSWWRYFWYLAFAWLIIPGIIAWIKRKSIVLRVYRGRIVIEEGILSKEHSEFLISDIRSIDIKQSLLARIVDIGDVTISTAASSDATEQIPGVPHPRDIQQLIISQRYGGRGRETKPTD